MLYPVELRALWIQPSCFGENLVGADGFEPPTLCSQSRCATRLRHAPMPDVPPRGLRPGPDVTRAAMIRALPWAIKGLWWTRTGVVALLALWYRAASGVTGHTEKP